MSAHDPTVSTPRRAFVGSLAGSALLMTTGFGGTADLLAAAPGGSADAWLTDVKGKYRQLFDAVSVNDGAAFAFAMNFLNTVTQAYNVPDRNVTAVVGLRHFAIPLAFNDDIWARYKLGETLKIDDPVTKKPAVRNPYAYVKEGELPFPGMAFEKLQQRGVVFTVCNVALTLGSAMAAEAAGLPKEKARDEWVAGMFKGVHLVPSGVLAVNRAQKPGGCTYCAAG